MRETRQSGSEGGGACGAPYPYPDRATSARFPLDTTTVPAGTAFTRLPWQAAIAVDNARSTVEVPGSA